MKNKGKSEGMEWLEYVRCRSESVSIIADKKLRQRVLQKTNGHCYYCGIAISDTPRKLHIDHLVPLRAGGKSVFSNLVPACPGCNIRKNGKSVDEWRNSLQKKIQETKIILSSLESLIEKDAFWFERNLTQHAPDAGESAPLQGSFYTPAESKSQALSTPPKRG